MSRIQIRSRNIASFLSLSNTLGCLRNVLYLSGFANNQFNFDKDSHLGNKVWLVNDYRSVECEVFTAGCTREMIQCYTP